MDYSQIPDEEKLCVNCANYQRSFSLIAFLDRLLDDGSLYHRCVLGQRTSLNRITGKQGKIYNDVSCQHQLTSKCRDFAGWEPSERWKRRKENLFKLLKS